MIASDDYVVRSPDLVWRTLDGEAIVMTDDGSQIHMLNKVASLIWQLADGKVTVSDIVARICDRFDVEEDVAQADTLEFIQQLLDRRIIQLDSQI